MSCTHILPDPRLFATAVRAGPYFKQETDSKSNGAVSIIQQKLSRYCCHVDTDPRSVYTTAVTAGALTVRSSINTCYTTGRSDLAIWLVNRTLRMSSNQCDSTPYSLDDLLLKAFVEWCYSSGTVITAHCSWCSEETDWNTNLLHTECKYEWIFSLPSFILLTYFYSVGTKFVCGWWMCRSD